MGTHDTIGATPRHDPDDCPCFVFLSHPDKPRDLDRMRRCPECGEYMVHRYVPELEAFTFFCEKCKIAAVPLPLRPSDFGFEVEPLPDFGDGGFKHFIEHDEGAEP